MNVPPQGSNTLEIHAPQAAIWNVLVDAQSLPQWMPMVLSTTGTLETLHETRRCEVNFNGRSGSVRERCVVFEPMQRIGWRLEEDSLGIGRMLEGMAFDFHLEPCDVGTRLTNTTYYKPRHFFASLMSALVMRRNFASVRKQVLANLKTLVEEESSIGRVA